jgi:hypothetical protein
MTANKKITITMSERRPITIVAAEWPKIGEATWHDGQIECQANTEAYIRVRQSETGKTIVYGGEEAGNGGQHAGYRAKYAGYLIGQLGEAPSDDEIAHTIRRVAGVIGHVELGDECIGSLPAEDVSPW